MKDHTNTSSPPQGLVTQLVIEWSQGDPEALNRLIPLVFEDLRSMARRYFRGGETLQPTAAVNELYLKLYAGEFENLSTSQQFFAFAGRVLRNLVIDYFRARERVKRGGGVEKAPLQEIQALIDHRKLDPIVLIEVGRALDQLQALDPQLCNVMELWHFAGLTVDETAQVLNISGAKVKRERAIGRRWLTRALADWNQKP